MSHFVIRMGILLGLAFASVPIAAHATSPGAGVNGSDTIFAHGFESGPRPNIILMIMDDVGIDQMASFGYGGANPPKMPNINAIAGNGVRFRNTWSMPECSPTRSVLLTGRYPLRNNVYQALGPDDLANSQVSEYEVAVPKLLDNAGYKSGKFGKFHLGGPNHNAAGHGLPGKLGWDRFHGWIEGVPASIDSTAGGVAAPGTYSCGFVPDIARNPQHGADTGACYVRGASGIGCSVIAGTNPAGDSPGLQCLTRGGILVPNAACEGTPPANLVWDRENAHYASPLVRIDDGKIDEAAIADPRGRGYRATLEANAAIEWIHDQQKTSDPWMATVSFTSAHTPMQHPPGALLPSGVGNQLRDDCSGDAPLNQRRVFDAMIEAMDTEFGRVLVETGIATTGPDGKLVYDPAASNTVIVILGDNGSFAPTVKVPFDLARSKGTAYQTGVWVPLIVSGPVVAAPGRTVEHMVNVADIYSLFGEVAGLNVPALVPRPLDAQPMLPYLTDPAHGSIREFNFTQGGLNIQANGARNGPCVLGNLCSHTPMSKSVCFDNGGTWWGVDPDEGVIKGGLEQCWQVNQTIFYNDPPNYASNRYQMAPTTYRAIRNEHYKLVQNIGLDYDPTRDTGVEVSAEELYLVNQAVPVPLLDRESHNLLADGKLTPIEALAYARLHTQMDAVLASQVACPGDGNDDGRVDQADIDNYLGIVSHWSGSSTYDFNLDSFTNAADLQIIQDNLGTACFTMSP